MEAGGGGAWSRCPTSLQISEGVAGPGRLGRMWGWRLRGAARGRSARRAGGDVGESEVRGARCQRYPAHDRRAERPPERAATSGRTNASSPTVSGVAQTQHREVTPRHRGSPQPSLVSRPLVAHLRTPARQLPQAQFVAGKCRIWCSWSRERSVDLLGFGGRSQGRG